MTIRFKEDIRKRGVNGQCGLKKAFRRKSRAKIIAKKRRGTEVYKCTICKMYHVGHSSVWRDP